jgi:SAM-dependent methyltransferase
MFSEHYIDWRESRMNGVKKFILPDYFKAKTLLELGCGNADVGNMFYELGATVTSSDARKEHLDVVNEKYPQIKTLLIDCDNDSIQEKYDVIVHWGVLYHIKEVESHLENTMQNCDVLLLETEVSDSDDKEFYIEVDEDGYDQAFNKKGIRPSQMYIESILEKNGFQYKLIKDPILNTENHFYDWNISNTNTWRNGLRRFWICWKNIDSPLVDKINPF